MTQVASARIVPFIGDTTPEPPESGYGLWLSTALADVSIPSGPGKRTPILRGDQTYDAGGCQEPSAWYWGGRWYATYSAGAAVCLASSVDPRGPWEKHGQVLGNGAGGFAGAPQHGYCYLDEEAGQLYYFFVDSLTPSRWRVATASANTPTAWSTVADTSWSFTLPSDYRTGGLGNVAVLKASDGKFVMVFESSFGSNGWQMGVAIADSLLGAYSVVQFPLTTLRPPQLRTAGLSAYPCGSMFITEEDGRYVLIYSISIAGTGAGLRTEIYRAVSRDLNNWTTTDQGYPLIRAAAPEEVDQVVDPHFARGPGGAWWAFWAANDNTLNMSLCVIMAAPCTPAQRVWDGDAWRHVDRGDDYAERALIRTPAQTTDRTGTNGQETVYDTTNGSRTHSLRIATQGSRERVVNAGPTGGANTVTVTPNGTDTVSNAGSPLTVGQRVDYTCYVTGRWSRSGA